MYLLLLSLWFSLSITPSSLPTSDCLLPTADCLLPTAYSPLPTNSILATSTDAGRTWIDLTGNLPGESSPISLLIHDGEYLIGGMSGVFRGYPAIPSPKWKLDELTPKEITGIFPGHDGPYAISQWKGIFHRSYMTGLWTPVTKTLKDKRIYTMLETQDGTLYAGCDSGLYKSGDQGETWIQVYNKGVINKLVESNGAVLAIAGDDIIRTTDAGHHWDQVLTHDGSAFQLQEIPEGLLAIFSGIEFAGVLPPNEIFLSQDHGATWKPVFTSLPKTMRDVYNFAQSGENYFACSNHGIFRSGDHGATWEVVLSVPPDKGGFYQLLTSDQVLYALFVPGC
ncbi:MAG TPA: hypothetical protein VJ508_06190 [Saprospiraceae bacterium]|nr:hypothetical protein [Saprospiraceae bacterium]